MSDLTVSRTRGRKRVVVAGAGLAGLAAAWRLGGRGLDIFILDRRSEPGGRASSFSEPATGRIVDCGQHVVLGACDRFLKILGEWGLRDAIAWRDNYTIYGERAGRARIVNFGRSPRLPLKLQFLPSLAGFSLLTVGERLGAVALFIKISRLREADLSALENITFEEWLISQKTPERCIRVLVEPVIVGALNGTAREVSARAALWVLRTGFLDAASHSRLGVPRGPLADFYQKPVLERFVKNGAEFALKSELTKVNIQNGRVVSVEAGGRTEPCDALVLAVNFDGAERIAGLRGIAEVSALAAVPHAPILSGHFFFHENVFVASGEIALTGRTAQWIFDRAAASGRSSDRGHLVTIVSAAREIASLPRAEIERRLLADIRAAVPSARGAEPSGIFVTTVWNATILSAPGVERRRPAARTSVGGLFLASDACATGWPSTMEGAVRAGETAAAAVLEELA